MVRRGEPFRFAPHERACVSILSRRPRNSSSASVSEDSVQTIHRAVDAGMSEERRM